MNGTIEIYASRILALLVAIIGHEIAHGYVAYLNGDTTAKRDGRLSINPINHVDPLGLVCMVIFRFGWAKAVPINPYAFRKRKLGMITVSLAGVVYNLVMAFIFSGVFAYLYFHPTDSNFIQLLVENLLWYNIMLGIFNLVPLPPLDGSKVLASFLPRSWEDKFYQYEKYAYVLLLVAIFSGAIDKVLGPILNGLINYFLNFWGHIFYV